LSSLCYGTPPSFTFSTLTGRHPRIPQAPTRSSSLNVVEGFFRDVVDKRIRRSVFRDVEGLIFAIEDYIEHYNSAPRATHLDGQREGYPGKSEACQKKPG
jgi:hypothetical protein